MYWWRKPPAVNEEVSKSDAKAAGKLASAKAKEKHKDGPLKKQFVYPDQRKSKWKLSARV